MNAANLLHNMSVAPKTNVDMRAHPEQDLCRSIVVELPVTGGEAGAGRFLQILDGHPYYGSTSAAELELQSRLNRHARTLPWPPVILIIDQATDATEHCSDLLTALTVLSKSSRSVYLRDKEPNLAAVERRGRVVLRLPIENGAKS